MNNSPVGTIVFDHVSKRYRLGTLGTLRGALEGLMQRGDNGARNLWALKDVSFRVEKGDSLGLIGPNGAGKTTTLKLLSNITKPTAGRISVKGRFSSLIELGAGFHPELTGRENIFLNGAILGLSRHEIRSKLDEIVAFSELERFIDTPVKRYSSGMYVRLGFAVAAHVEPDILLVDEVLAVGDASFRHRCIEHMRKLRQNGTTVVFVSHNMHLVQGMCDSALLLVNGQIKSYGATADVIAEYQSFMLGDHPQYDSGNTVQQHGFQASAHLILETIEIETEGQRMAGRLPSHLPARLRIHYKTPHPHQVGRIDVQILRDDSTLCSHIDSVEGNHPSLLELGGQGVIEITYDPLQLTSGNYYAIVRVTDLSDSIVIASAQSQPFGVYADSVKSPVGVYVPSVRWSIT